MASSNDVNTATRNKRGFMSYSAQVEIVGAIHEAIGATEETAWETLRSAVAKYARRLIPDSHSGVIAATYMADAIVVEMNPARGQA